MRVLSVEYFKDYKLKIKFSDNATKIIDFEDKLNHPINTSCQRKTLAEFVHAGNEPESRL